jgi:hypothetical protein
MISTNKKSVKPAKFVQYDFDGNKKNDRIFELQNESDESDDSHLKKRIKRKMNEILYKRCAKRTVIPPYILFYFNILNYCFELLF